MGRIKKAAGPKHEATLSPALSEFVTKATSLPLSQLPKHLQSFPPRWPFPRGDLYHWIPLLDHFDSILEQFIREYGLNRGPQTQPFARRLLEKDISSTESELSAAATDFGPEGDLDLVETILTFSRSLLENCGNRSLYSSSDRLGELLNTTSLSLLSTTLRLATRLAQRYYASRQRGSTSSQHLNNALLASHYNINLDHVQQLADKHVRPNPLAAYAAMSTSATPAAPSGAKGKRKDSLEHGKPTALTNGCDLFSAVKETIPSVNSSISHGGKASGDSARFEDCGEVRLLYYQTARESEDDKKVAVPEENKAPDTPETPTPVRRTSGVSRPSRLSMSEDSSSSTHANAPVKLEDASTGVLRVVVIPATTIASTPIEKILDSNLNDLPKHCHYEFLCKIRAARAMTESLFTRRQIIAIRILAITNLAYVYPETMFQQKILQQDSEEPRRLQLTYQLADIIHPPGGDHVGMPIYLKTIALGALEALSKHKSRAPDVCTALSVNVNHGVLLYMLRKTLADLAVEVPEEDTIEMEEWRDALFSLLEALPSAAPRTAESLLSAGLFDVLVEVLTLRTSKAERTHPKALMFMNTIIYTVRDAFQSFANAKGLDAIADLISWEVSTALQRVKQGGGLPEQFKNQVMDYQMPYFQQQTLRWLLKFVNHMMQHGNTNFDRLLRNLIDSPQLLSGLRQIIADAKVFGSNVWSGAVNILSSFIHNEPTSYAVIAEAGLSKALLEAITLKPVEMGSQPPESGEAAVGEHIESAETVTVPIGDGEDSQPKQKVKVARAEGKILAQGILPATDAIVTIPNAFGAICLNTSGLEMFLRSGALESFFEVFESPDHVKSLASETDLPRILGNAFDELVRHHPKLKSAVLASVILMLARVVRLCQSQARNGVGAKLWTEEKNGGVVVSGGKEALLGDITEASLKLSTTDIDNDVVMGGQALWKLDETTASEPASKETKPPEQHSLPVSTYIKVTTKFLLGFFENNTLCTLFIEAGGFESILDFATLPSLPYDFNNHAASHEVARVVHMLIEHKPHIVLPSLIHRTMKTLDSLEPLMSYSGGSSFFSQFVLQSPNTTNSLQVDESRMDERLNGTSIIKALVNVHTLCNMFYETFTPPAFSHRAQHHTLFSQVNLADLYVYLVKRLGYLHRSCVWQEILLQNSISESLQEATRIKGYGMGSDEADEIFGFINRDRPTTFAGQAVPTASSSPSPSRSNSATDVFPKGDTLSSTASKLEDTALFQNVQSLRYLLSQIPSSITPFLQGLGKSLVPKRRLDSYLRQCAYMVADALAESTLEQLRYELPKKSSSMKDQYAYWIVIMTSISQLIMEGPLERPHSQCLTLVLQSFKNHGGMDAIKDLLVTFFDEVKALSNVSDEANRGVEDAGRLASAYGGIKIILTFYSQITTSKNIVESQQTTGMSSQDRDREHPYYFSASQFLVELRMAVLPVVRSIWDSDFADRASSSILKCLIGILGTILDAEHEHGALKRTDTIPMRGKPQYRIYNINREREKALVAKGIKPELAREALYRCLNNREAAEEYCKARNEIEGYTENPIPSYDVEKSKSPSPIRTPRREDSQATVPDADSISQTDRVSLPSTASPVIRPSSTQNPQVEIEETGDNGLITPAMLPPPAPEWPPETEVDDGEDMPMNIDNLLSITNLLNPTTDAEHDRSNSRELSTPASATVVEATKLQEMTTVDDLEDERSAVRKNLIDRALDVLAVHGDVTFELADLITTAAAKAPDAATMRREIGETLIQSLISFQMPEEDGEDLKSTGKKIAAYANLLALVLQEKEFYDASLDELRSNLPMLLTFIKISPISSEQTSEDASPWVGQILLIVEKLLAEDVQPQQIKWTPPNSDGSVQGDTIVEMEEPGVSQDDKMQLMEAIIDILPRIGKDDSLALSVTRILVILSRNRDIANILSEKRNLQRLFVMVKQLAGINSEKLQSSFMLVLRHIIEDDDTVRQIMRSEIVANFETRSSRPTDTTGYVRQMYHLVLRSPSIFVEVTNEKLKLQSFDPNQRPQVLILKSEGKESAGISEQKEDAAIQNPAEDGDASSKDDIKLSTEETNTSGPLEKSKTQDVKAPVVEQPDGVIHYLLSQLLSYKDVEDKDSESGTKDAAKTSTPAPASDVEMTNGSTPPPRTSLPSAENDTEKKNEKTAFKSEQHPIFIYRCFLLSCLAELLSSYNRTKIEFINFSRKADPKAMTPSKPRSGVLNYLLNVLIPIGTLDVSESHSHRKKATTSSWAISTIVSLCMRTGERGYEKSGVVLSEEQEPNLLFVRKFVLEHALKAYKDAHASTEALDVKYARMLSIADLFNRLLAGRPTTSNAQHVNNMTSATQRELAKIMFERSFISSLTASIADIDLNFPGSKRAVKHILKPLKVLTETAIFLSENSSISTTPGLTSDDEISTASSVSDMDDEREETPDLFRHSTLGMLEPGREDESSSEASDEDEDMYEDEYDDDGMADYDEDMDRDGDEVISDEDDEIEGAGHVEGLSGDVGMDVEVVIDGDDEDDDDEDDDPDDSEDMDDGGELEIIDEINGDGDNDSLVEGDEEEWQDEDDEGDVYPDEDGMDQESSDTHDHQHHHHHHHDEDLGPPPRNLVQDIIGAGPDLSDLNAQGFADLTMDIENEVYMDDVVREDDDDDDDDEEDFEDEDVIYEPEMDDEDSGLPDPPWGWDTEDDASMQRGQPHHHGRRLNPWTIFPTGERGMLVPAYNRSHRIAGAPRGTDDGVNPLLLRQGQAGTPAGHARNRHPPPDAGASMSDWVHAINSRNQADGAVSFINSIVSAVGQGGPAIGTIGGPGALHFHIGGTAPNGRIPPEVQAVLGLRRPMPEPVRSVREDPLQMVDFVPTSTVIRWQEEARLLYGTSYNEKTQRVVNSLLKILVPPVIEEERVRKQKEAEAAEALKKQREEEAKAKAVEEERLAKEKAEKEAQEKQEQEERDAAALAAAEDESAPEEAPAQANNYGAAGEAMEGVEPTEPPAPTVATVTTTIEDISHEAGPSEQPERVRATFRGREVDITGLGIDLEYLDALPDELREEVLMQQLAEQRSQAAAAGEEPTEISREFLEALPAEIREELLQQEAQERRRREREENRRRSAGNGASAVARAEEMDPASFLASLDPHLRDAVLAEQSDAVIAQLPADLAEEARRLGRSRMMQHGYPSINRLGVQIARADPDPESVTKKPPRRQIVQMLDKAGVATLLRLLFVSQQGSSRQTLNEILHNVSQNRQNRAEVVSLLLSILQDGSADINAVERSFVHLSLRAKQPASQKTPQPVKRTLTGQMAAPLSAEMTPLMVIQQCLNALVYLTELNPHIPSFFLTEHETSTGLKGKSSKKGKGKESRASKFALNALLSLLDRKLIMESSGCMEQLSTLLQSITHPLTMLLRKDKDKTTTEVTKDEAPTTEAVEGASTAPPTVSEGADIQTDDTNMADPSSASPEAQPEAATATEAIDNADNTITPEVTAVQGEVRKDDADKTEAKETPKKQRNLTPPVVPEYNLRLVVNILAARECSAKTFRDTLSTINNLSAIPHAKEIFGKELIKQAQDLGDSISQDLDDLIPQIKSAGSGTDIQGMALAKFSPSSSDQAKLLRVLTALDYLFDPKRNGGKTKTQAKGGSSKDEPKEDLLTTLYENPTFGPLWTKLSDCLSCIRQRDNMVNVATILLPLVEALMVVCKNTTLKDVSSMKMMKEFTVASPPPESPMENLFFRFTEDHRKILNDLVRHNPRLMSGTFSLLVKNPKVLEFDNKRNYFTRRLHTRTDQRHPQPPLQLSVRRDQVFLDSFKSLYFKSPEEMKFGKLSIRFHGEEGVDAGGVTREWFQVMSRQMFNADYALFIPVASDRTTFHPNVLSHINPEHLMFFKFIGRVIGKALYEGRALDCHFSRAVYKRILGKPVSIKDMETLDLDYYKSLLWMLENDISDIITETFSIETEAFGVTQIVDLIDNGRSIPVTEENKQEYVQLVVEYRLTGSVKAQLEEFLKGFHDIVPAELISIFNEQELELLISGLPDIDVDDWKNNTEYHNYQASSPQIQWFWRAVRSFDKEERAKLLQFVTGTSKVPLNGFKELEGMNGFSRFNIHRDYGNKDRLPSSHTCFNQLDLPEYESYDALRQQVYTAMTAGSGYFGFA